MLVDQDVRGVQVPDSNFVRQPDRIATASAMASIWQRVRGASTGGQGVQPRGTGLVSTKALPSARSLLDTTLNTVEASERSASP